MPSPRDRSQASATCAGEAPASNYYPDRGAPIAELDAGETTSSSLVQRHLAGSRVVKGFNNLAFFSLAALARPSGSADRSALPIAGDDDVAKTEAAELLDALGYDAVDIGTLADSWRSEPGTPVYVQPYFPQGQPPADLGPEEQMRWYAEALVPPAPAARVKELADGAVRG